MTYIKRTSEREVDGINIIEVIKILGDTASVTVYQVGHKQIRERNKRIRKDQLEKERLNVMSRFIKAQRRRDGR